MRPVVKRAQQHQVGQFGGAAVFPVPDVMGVQAAGRPTARHHTAVVAVLQGAAQPAADRAGGPPRHRSVGRGVRTTPRRWHHRSGIAGRRRSAADPDAGRRRVVSTSRWTTTVVCWPCGRRAASASQPASTRRRNASTVLGIGGDCSASGRRGRVSTRRSAPRDETPAPPRTVAASSWGSVIRHQVNCSSPDLVIDGSRFGRRVRVGARFELDRGAQLADRGHRGQLRVVLIGARRRRGRR